MNLKLELSKVHWNNKFIAHINSVAQSPEAKSFLLKTANDLKNWTIPKLPYNQYRRYYSYRKIIRDSIYVGKVRRFSQGRGSERFKSAKIEVNFRGAPKYTFFAIAGQRTNSHTGSKIIYKYSNTQAVPYPLAAVYREKIKPTFQSDFVNLFNVVLEKGKRYD